jgi:hypothetical protein
VASPTSTERGFVGIPVTVGRYILAPGQELVVPDDELLQRQLPDLVAADAVAVGSQPAWYRVAKERKKAKG